MNRLRLLVAVALVATTVGIVGAVENTTAAPAATLNIPYTVSSWQGADAAPLDAETEGAIAADLVVNRDYVDADGTEVGLYVAYYNQQRPGVSIHSPLHCLPGTGWEVVSNDLIGVDISSPVRSSPVRRLIAQKGASRVIVLYWYSINGQMITSEIGSRLQLLSNRVRLGRNDAALVRVAVLVTDTDAAAEHRAAAFVRALTPHLL